MEQFLRIGVITSTHGVRGEVKVFPTTDSPQRFREVKDVILRTKTKDIRTEIKGARFFKNLAIVQFDCFSSPEEAAKYTGAEVYIDRKDGQPLEEGEYYIADLIGCQVIAEDGTMLGIVRDVLQTGANDVYVVGCGVPDEKGLKEKEILLPVIKDCIKQVDIEKGEILVHIMPGLLDQ